VRKNDDLATNRRRWVFRTLGKVAAFLNFSPLREETRVRGGRRRKFLFSAAARLGRSLSPAGVGPINSLVIRGHFFQAPHAANFDDDRRTGRGPTLASKLGTAALAAGSARKARVIT